MFFRERVRNWVKRYAEEETQAHNKLLSHLATNSLQEAGAYQEALVTQHNENQRFNLGLLEVIGAMLLTLSEEPLRLSPEMLATASSLPAIRFDDEPDGGIVVSFSAADEPLSEAA